MGLDTDLSGTLETQAKEVLTSSLGLPYAERGEAWARGRWVERG